MPEIIVVNKYKLREQLPAGFTQVYIGRPSEYGNPFVVGKKYSRGEAVQAYRDLAEAEGYDYPKLRTMLEQGQNIALVCFCKPQSCHGDVIKERLDDRYNNSSDNIHRA